MLKHSYPFINSVIRNERHPTNSDATIYFFEAYKRDKHSRKSKLLDRKIIRSGIEAVSMQLTKCTKGCCDAAVPYKNYIRLKMSLSEFTSLHPDGIIHDPFEEAKTTLGAFVLHKKAVWRKSYVSVSDLSTKKENVSHKVCCFIERIDHEKNNKEVHEQANFLVESFKAHPVSGKCLQGLSVYKNTQTDYEKMHFPDTIIEFAIVPKTGKFFAALLQEFCENCTSANVTFGVFKRKQLLTSPEWV